MSCLLDADEFFYCPSASASVEEQRNHQQSVMNKLSNSGAQELRFAVLVYAARGLDRRSNSSQALSILETCMQSAAALKEGKDFMTRMFACWSSRCTYFVLPKSADLASICPFHYNVKH